MREIKYKTVLENICGKLGFAITDNEFKQCLCSGLCQLDCTGVTLVTAKHDVYIMQLVYTTYLDMIGKNYFFCNYRERDIVYDLISHKKGIIYESVVLSIL